MKTVGSVGLALLTAILIATGFLQSDRSGRAIGAESGSMLSVGKLAASTPEQAVAKLLTELQKRDWGAAYSELSNASEVDREQFTREVAGSDGSLRSQSTLVGWELAPLHETASDGLSRAVLHWSTAVGPIDEVRDLKVLNSGTIWKVIWPVSHPADAPAQIISVNYLRWDLVTPPAKADGWVGQNMDAPRVRILSMNAVDFQGGSIVMGEVVNEDTIPAFVNVNAALINQSGQIVDEESSFDKIAHVLLPKQVSAYRIDFPSVALKEVKNVHMDISTSLVPASADPVIGVMDQRQETDVLGKATLRGSLLNESGQTVNVPHVIVSFYDNNGKVIWVSDGYVQHALYPQVPEPFAVEIPARIAGKIQNYHVVVNQYSIGKS
jgi:hypothetical protein